MTTLLVHNKSSFMGHQTPPGHPERPDRIRIVEETLAKEDFNSLVKKEAPIGQESDISRVHPATYIAKIKDAIPTSGLASLDGDTTVSNGSWDAALRGVGACCLAVDEVINQTVKNAFCASRPPGHHAEKTTAMGFCLFNNVAVAARYAQNKYNLDRVAIIDFDVHHGNGTQDIFWDDKTVMYSSTHQMPLYPGTGAKSEQGEANTIVNAPLAPNNGSEEFKSAMNDVILPRIEQFSPDLIIISAGFDAHTRDPLANINLVKEDFEWITKKLMEIAENTCQGRIISVLEGGYDLTGLAESVAIHVKQLMDS